MTLTITPGARATIEAWLARDPALPFLRLAFVGGCGALGYRLSPAAGPAPGEHLVEIDGLRLLVDFKSLVDLDGATVETGEDASGELVIVHDRAVVGGSC